MINFLTDLKDGDYGLAKTYWLFGVIGNIVINILILPLLTASIILFIVGLIIIVIYTIIVLIGIWNAASDFNGSSFWSVLAKIAVVLGFISAFTTYGSLLLTMFVN